MAASATAGKVLLISVNRCAIPDPVFPLGLAYLTSALRRAGYETLWADALAGGEKIEETLARYRPDAVGISLRNIDDAAILRRETYYDGVPTLCEVVRRSCGSPVILGGSGFSLFPRQLLERSGADYGVCGEGETSIVMLLDALRGGGKMSEIPGLVHREDGRVVVNPQVFQEPTPAVEPGIENSSLRLCPRLMEAGPAGSGVHGGVRMVNCPENSRVSSISDPETRSEPAAARLDWRREATEEQDRPAGVAGYYVKTAGMLNVQSQRGCPYRCCYCSYPLVEGARQRRRSADAVAEEFEQLERLGARYVFIVDSIFNSSHGHVTETCEALLRRGNKLPWCCFLRPKGLTPELMALMKRAGLAYIDYGSDSFCDETLAAYQKDLTFEDVRRSSELAAREKIPFCHFLICGGPGETAETMRRSYEASLSIAGGVILAVIGMRIYPETPLHRRAIAEGVIGADSDLLEPAYYLAPGLTAQSVSAQLAEFSRLSPNWIVGDPVPEYLAQVERLRRKGIAGPLWSHIATLQRLRPRG